MQLVLITGSMGSGKTLVLKELFLKLLNKYKTVLIVHEAGFIGMDATYLAQNNIPALNYSYCKVAEDPGQTFMYNLENARQKFNPDIVCAEITGNVATPVVIKEAKNRDSDIHIQAVIYVLDATSFLSEYRKKREFLQLQIAWSDYVIVNKEEQLNLHQKESIRKIIKAINPYATVLETRYGILSRDLLAKIAIDLQSPKVSIVYSTENNQLETKRSLWTKGTESKIRCGLLFTEGSTEPKKITNFFLRHKDKIVRAKGRFVTGYGLCYLQLNQGIVDYQIFSVEKYFHNKNIASLLVPTDFQADLKLEFVDCFER